MTIFQALFLGIVQGITEFLPISSSGHLIAIPQLFGFQPGGLVFDVAVHVGTLLAILVALRSNIADALKSPKLIGLIAAATIPVVFVGLFVPGDFFDSLRTVPVVIGSLAFWGIVLALADKYARHQRELAETTWISSIVVGLIQIIALVPGTSRSGITMTGGLLSGMNRDAAARFSFLIAIPAIAGAGLLTGLDAVDAQADIDWGIIAAGVMASFFSGLIAIRWLLKVIRKIGFGWFAAYRLLLAMILLLLLS
jgi:undecaprenyl-diphosphatase